MWFSNCIPANSIRVRSTETSTGIWEYNEFMLVFKIKQPLHHFPLVASNEIFVAESEILGNTCFPIIM